MSTLYDDIINHPHHVSRNHPQMSMHDRAAQFSPFAALVGFEDAVDESGRVTESRRDLDGQEQAELNRRLTLLESKLAERPEVRITCFIPDRLKAGGAYEIISGRVTKLSSFEGKITMHDGTVIKISDIFSLCGEIFDSMEKI